MEGGGSGGGGGGDLRPKINTNLSLSEFPQLAFLAQVMGGTVVCVWGGDGGVVMLHGARATTGCRRMGVKLTLSRCVVDVLVGAGCAGTYCVAVRACQ